MAGSLAFLLKEAEEGVLAQNARYAADTFLDKHIVVDHDGIIQSITVPEGIGIQ